MVLVSLMRSVPEQPSPRGGPEARGRVFRRGPAFKKFLIFSAALTLGGALAACSEPPAESPWSAERMARLPLREKAAQMVVARVVVPASGVPLALTDTPGVGGVEVAGGDAVRAAALLDSLRRDSPLPPLVLARLERGLGAVLEGATELPAPAELGSAVINKRAAQAVAAEARAVGVDLAWIPGPRLPDPVAGGVGSVAATGGPAATAEFLRDLRQAGLPAIVTALDPPRRAQVAPVLRWDRAALDAGALASLRSAVQDSVTGVQLGWVALPSLTGDSVPLPLSRVASAGVVRRDLGFGGLLVADVGPGSPLQARFGAQAPVAAVAGGADLLVGVVHPAAVVDALAAAVESGALSAGRLDESVRRIFALKERLGVQRPRTDSLSTVPAALRGTEALGLAEELHGRAVNVAGARPATLLRGCARTVIVLPPNARLPEFTSELARRTRGLAALGTPWVARRGPLSALPQWPANEASCVIAVALPGAAPRVVERLPGVAVPVDTVKRDSTTAPADTASRHIVYVSFLPAPGDSIPAVPSVVLAWGTGPEAQRAAARAVAGALVREEVAPRPLAWPAARTLQRAPASEAGMSADSLARIDRLMRKAISEGVFTSGAVAVGRRGKLVKLTGYGRVGGRPLDPEITLFDLASLTKVVGTTAAAMALTDDGQLPLDAPVRRYVPQFRGGEKSGITIRHLLTHTSGLPAGADLFSDAREPAGALRRVFRTALVYSPGEKMEYSDFGMIAMAEVVRRRAEVPVDLFLARRVFGPLGMESTQYDPPMALTQPVTVPTALRSDRPYVLRGVVHDANAFRLGGVTGHAGLFSTAHDLAVYSQTLLNGGAYGARRVWSPRTVRIYAAPQGLPGNRGLGWDKPGPRSSAGDYFSSSSFGHLGYTGTSMWIDPQRDLFVIILTNRTYDRGSSEQIYGVRQTVNTAAVLSITDVTITPRPGTVAARPKPKPKPKPKPRRPPTRRRR
jgi:CubicO group peptidase (beta-lactamase class C family)/beta-glucosidase-like glycosyl hydrolase